MEKLELIQESEKVIKFPLFMIPWFQNLSFGVKIDQRQLKDFTKLLMTTK